MEFRGTNIINLVAAPRNLLAYAKEGSGKRDKWYLIPGLSFANCGLWCETAAVCIRRPQHAIVTVLPC